MFSKVSSTEILFLLLYIITKVYTNTFNLVLIPVEALSLVINRIMLVNDMKNHCPLVKIILNRLIKTK